MAVQTIPGVFNYPSLITFAVTGSFGLINDDTDEVAYSFAFPKSGTLTQIAITTATTTTGTVTPVNFRIETIGTDGNPSGTLYDANGTGTLAIATTDDSVVLPISINGGTGITVAQGDIVALRWTRVDVDTYIGSVLAITTSQSGITSSGLPGLYDYNIGGAGVWTRTVGAPVVALNISGWVTPTGCLGGVTTIPTGEAIQSPKERGILINVPVGYRATGASLVLIAAAATSLKVRLYSDPTGTPTLVAETAAMDTDMLNSAAAARRIDLDFVASFTMSANTDYVLAVAPQGAVDVTPQYYPANATYAAAYPGGSTAVWYARDNSASGAFSATTTRIPRMSLRVDGINSGISTPFIIGG